MILIEHVLVIIALTGLCIFILTGGLSVLELIKRLIRAIIRLYDKIKAKRLAREMMRKIKKAKVEETKVEEVVSEEPVIEAVEEPVAEEAKVEEVASVSIEEVGE